MLDQDNRKSDDGEYTCRVENRYGAVQHTIRVQVSMSTCQHMSTHVNTCQHVTISTLRLVQSVERVVAQPPVVMPGQPGNHSATVGDSVTLSCQLTVQDVATPHTTAWFK